MQCYRTLNVCSLLGRISEFSTNPWKKQSKKNMCTYIYMFLSCFVLLSFLTATQVKTSVLYWPLNWCNPNHCSFKVKNPLESFIVGKISAQSQLSTVTAHLLFTLETSDFLSLNYCNGGFTTCPPGVASAVSEHKNEKFPKYILIF